MNLINIKYDECLFIRLKAFASDRVPLKKHSRNVVKLYKHFRF